MIVLGLLFDWIGYSTARHPLPAITLGSATADDLASSRSGFDQLGAQRGNSGQRLLFATMAGWIGVIFGALSVTTLLAFV